MNSQPASLTKQKSGEVTNELQLRFKKQSRIYSGISNLIEKDITVDELLNAAKSLLQNESLHPGLTAVSIFHNDQSYSSKNRKDTEWAISSDRIDHKGCTIKISIHFLKEHLFLDTKPWITEEKNLLDSIAVLLATKAKNIESQQEMNEKQRLLDKAYKLARIGTWEYDMLADKLHWSPVTKEVHGFGLDYEPDVEKTIQLFKEGFNRTVFAQTAHDAIEHHKPFDVELKIVSGQGDERWIRATGEPEYENGQCVRFYGISQNVTDRKQAEEDLQLNEQRFKALVQDGSDMIAILDEEANYKYVSPSSKTVLGIPAEDFIGKNAFDFIHGDDKSRIQRVLAELNINDRIEIEPFRFRDPEGNWRWIETTITNMKADPAVGGLVANSRDITDKMLQQKQILNSLKEKETLLTEVHHRVKNNLAVVHGLLHLHTSQEERDEVIERLHDCMSRIQTMANIHEQLYQANDFSKLDFAENIRLLSTNIQKTFRSEKQIDMKLQCDPVQLTIIQAIPFSMIVNEIITNIFKHAFKGKENGRITLHLNEAEDHHIYLSIKDNGIGLPENVDPIHSSSLGINLIEVFSRQLNADYALKSDGKGTTFTLQFEKLV